MKRLIFNYFQFSRAERLGVVLLAGACAVVFVLPEIGRYFYRPQSTDFSEFAAEVQAFHTAMPDAPAGAGELFAFDPNTASHDDLLRLGLSERVAKVICNYRDKGGSFRRPEDLGKIYSLPKTDFERLLPFVRIAGASDHYPERPSREWGRTAEVFDFDPNTAPEADLLRLGLSPRLVSNILKYRGKGGQFRVREDFRKLYGLSEQDYARLEPYIFLPSAQTGPAPRPAAYAAGSTNRNEPPPRIDINAAALEDWKRLPGIGDTRARQIVQYRTLLGGFAGVEHVAETRGLPDSIFQKIKPFLVFETPVFQQININTASAEALDAHPWISAKQAQLITNFRAQHGPFATVNDLKKIAVFRDGSWLNKVRPYLKTE